MAAEDIGHEGTIIGIDGRLIDVRIETRGACDSCRARDMCAAGQAADKVVSVLSDAAEHFSVGERVTVWVTRMMGVRAVLYAYVFPFAAILGVLLVSLEAGAGELAAGLAALGAGAVYYIALSFFRSKIAKEIVFKIGKI